MFIPIQIPLSIKFSLWLNSHTLRGTVPVKVEGRQLLLDSDWLAKKAAEGDETAGSLLSDYIAGQNSLLPPCYRAKRGRPPFANDLRDMAIFFNMNVLMTVKGCPLEKAKFTLAEKFHLSDDAIEKIYKRILKAIKAGNTISVWCQGKQIL